jgi:hypothetical protein
VSERKHDERHGMHIAIVIGVLAGLGTVVALAAAAVYALAGAYDTRLAGPNAPLDAEFAEPRLQSAPQYDRSRFFAEKNSVLARYEWIDRGRGVARIPIEDAMRIVASGQRDAPVAGQKPQENAQ